VEGYLEKCESLRRVYVLVDAGAAPRRRSGSCGFLGARAVPYRWVGTKGDKLSARERGTAAARFAGEPWLAGAVRYCGRPRERRRDRPALADVRAAFSS